jgi:hypothetical protein
MQRGCFAIGHARDASTIHRSRQDGIRRDVTLLALLRAIASDVDRPA